MPDATVRMRIGAAALVGACGVHTGLVAWHASRQPEGKVAHWNELYDGPLFGQTWRLFGPDAPAVEWSVRALLVTAGDTGRRVEVSRDKLSRSLRRPWAPSREWRMEANAAVWLGAQPTGGADDVGCGPHGGDWVRQQLDQIALQQRDPQRTRLLAGVAEEILREVPEATTVELHLVASISRGAPGCSTPDGAARSASVFAGRWQRTST